MTSLTLSASRRETCLLVGVGMQGFRRFYPGEWLLAALLLLLAVAAFASNFSPRPASSSGWLLLGGRVSGILGLACLLLAGVLAARIPGTDRFFGGLTRLWRFHHVLGGAALLLLMLHPLLLAFAALPGGISAAAQTLFPPSLSEWAIWVGWLALLALMIFLAPTYSFFGPPVYQRWKRLHLLSGAAILLGLVHGLALNTTFSAGQGNLLWLLLGLLAVAAFAWRAVLAKKLARRLYRICSVDSLARGIVELAMEPASETGGDLPSEKLRFRSGQFVYMAPLDPGLESGRGEEHPYTISSAPQSNDLRIAIKDLGDATHALQRVMPGSVVEIEGPYGNFFPEAATGPELWLGGGIGASPFMSRAREIALAKRPVDIVFVYMTQDLSRAYFLHELEAIADRVEGFHVVAHFYAAEGPLSEKFLASHVPGLAGREAWICGPDPMIRLCKILLRKQGLAAGRIHSEEFTLL